MKEPEFPLIVGACCTPTQFLLSVAISSGSDSISPGARRFASNLLMKLFEVTRLVYGQLAGPLECQVFGRPRETQSHSGPDPFSAVRGRVSNITESGSALAALLSISTRGFATSRCVKSILRSIGLIPTAANALTLRFGRCRYAMAALHHSFLRDQSCNHFL